MTLVEAVAAWKSANSFPQKVCEDDKCRPTTQAEYNAMAADRGRMWLERVTAEEAESAEKTRQDQAKAAYDAIKAGTATAAQTQKVVAFLLRERFRELAP
jgi:hypothetical protein